MGEPQQTLPERRHYAAFGLLLALVLLWGTGHRFYEMLVPVFATLFSLSGTRQSLTEGAYQIVYVIGAIPAALIARSFGYRTALQVGLGSLCIGAFTFYPATETRGFAYFLFAVMLLSFGWITLEVSVNTVILGCGSKATAIRRLSLAQCLYPVGSLLGIVTARWVVQTGLVLPQTHFAYAIVHPYVATALVILLLAYLCSEIRFPLQAEDRSKPHSTAAADIRALLRNRHFGLAMAAQAANILVLCIAWLVADKYFHAGLDEFPHHEPGDLLLWCILLLAAGRLCATALMGVLRPENVLEIFAIGGGLAAVVAVASGPAAAACASFALCFFVAPAWPIIFGLALEPLQSRAKLAAALVTMAGALGAVAYHFLDTIPPRGLMIISALACTAMALFAMACHHQTAKPQAEDGLGDELMPPELPSPQSQESR